MDLLERNSANETLILMVKRQIAIDLERDTIQKEPFGFSIKKGSRGIVVSKIVKGGPAVKNLEKGDLIISVNKDSLDGVDCNEAMKLLNKSRHSVNLMVKRATVKPEGEVRKRMTVH